MTRGEVVMEMLEKQLKLLFERSQGCLDNQELAKLTDAMVSIISAIDILR